VERALGLDTRGGMGVRRVLPTLLDAYKPFIREMLEKHPRLRAAYSGPWRTPIPGEAEQWYPLHGAVVAGERAR